MTFNQWLNRETKRRNVGKLHKIEEDAMRLGWECCLKAIKEPGSKVPCCVGLSDIDPYNLECLAMVIVNHVNERTGVDVKKRQETNDENFDHVIKQVKTFLKEIGI